MEVRDYIIDQADKLFCQFGFKSVTMDDIAKNLGISKKTIYQHFADKNELVNLLMADKISSRDCDIEEQVKKSKDAVHEMFIGLEDLHRTLSEMNPKLFYDLKKYHVDAWLKFKEFKEKHIRQSVRKNLERGLAEGLFRTDINLQIITQLRLDEIDILFSQNDNYTQNIFSISQVMTELTEHYLYGICNEKGLLLIKKYKEEKPQEQTF